MNKYASQFNELIVLAEKEKSKKKGGSLAAVFKLVQDLTEFENNIQECVDAQEMAENKGKIEAFMNDMDKMYEVLFTIAKSGVQAIRSERGMSKLQEEVETEEPAELPVTPPVVESSNTFTAADLKKQMEQKPPAPVMLTIPKTPVI